MQFFDMPEPDARLADWAMMSSIYPTLSLCILFVICAKFVGPKLMENRKPFEIDNLLIAYNLFQVLFSAWFVYEAVWLFYIESYSFRCQPVDYSMKPITMKLINISWWYYISKFTEFFDTFFFVIRKKDKQITNLHVFHHSIMPVMIWIGIRYVAGGHSAFVPLCNAIVHTIMYTYYMMSAMGPEYKKYLWWKKYLTLLQLVQFALIFIHDAQLLFIECDFPKVLAVLSAAHALLFTYLFGKFYIKTYKRDAQQSLLLTFFGLHLLLLGMFQYGYICSIIETKNIRTVLLALLSTSTDAGKNNTFSFVYTIYESDSD